jgi:nicotinamidase-related amidase/tellurite resistance-related uncharacterized protein
MKLITTAIALIIGLNLGFAQKENNMNTALIIIDIQNDYFEGGKAELVNSDKASGNAKLLLEQFRKKNLPIVHIQHISNRPNATFFISDTKGAEIHNDVKPTDTEQIIIKHYPNSFRETNLLAYLKSKNITDLVICGMQTHMCVDATTRAAKDFGFSCIVIADACATKDLEINGIKVKASEVQTSFLSALNYFYSIVMTTNQYLAKWNRHNFFMDENELSDYVIEKEFPIWKKEDLPQKIVKVEMFARLQVLKGSFLFTAYDENNAIIYEETFDANNQQTLLIPNVRHTVKAIEEDTECQLQLYKQKPSR